MVWNIRAAVPAIQLSLSPVKLTLTVSGVGRVWEQDGVRSRHYDRGRYSPTREQGVHHFHRLLCEFLNAS